MMRYRTQNTAVCHVITQHNRHCIIILYISTCWPCILHALNAFTSHIES